MLCHNIIQLQFILNTNIIQYVKNIIFHNIFNIKIKTNYILDHMIYFINMKSNLILISFEQLQPQVSLFFSAFPSPLASAVASKQTAGFAVAAAGFVAAGAVQSFYIQHSASHG